MKVKYIYPLALIFAAELTRANASSFSFRQKIQADDNSTNYVFSGKNGVATYADIIVVGSYGNNVSAGGAYIFEFNRSTHLFEQVAKLTPSTPVPGAEFGASVAIYADTVVVGAPYENSYTGNVYVFEKPAAGWKDMNETAVLTNSAAAVQSNFGSAVAIYQDTIAASSPNSPFSSVTLFEKNGTHWRDMNESATLTSPSNLSADAWFGSSLALNANTLVAGTYQDHNENGAALVFEKPASGWQDMNHSTAKLTMQDRTNGDRLGNSVAVSGDLIMASAPYYANYKGAVFAFKKSSAHWSDMNASARIQSQTSSYQFGQSVCLIRNTLIVTEYDGGYFYDFTGTLTNDLNITDTLNTNPRAYGTGYGDTMACSDKRVVMGAYIEHNYEGRAYVFDADISNGSAASASNANPSLLMYLLN